MDIRLLTEEDAMALRALRLRALREHPEAFASSFEEEEHTPLENTVRHLREGPPNSVLFGAIVDGEIAGMVHFGRFTRVKTRHKASLGGMYVAPEARGRGAGKALLDAAIAHARSLGGVEDLTLAVTVGNDAARALYLRAGFVPYGLEPRYIKLGDRYYDIEWMIRQLGAG